LQQYLCDRVAKPFGVVLDRIDALSAKRDEALCAD
jgi:hypothetical protein